MKIYKPQNFTLYFGKHAFNEIARRHKNGRICREQQYDVNEGRKMLSKDVFTRRNYLC